MPKADEFKVHTMGGGSTAGSGNAPSTPQNTFQPNTGVSPSSQSSSIPKPSAPFSSSSPSSNPLGGMQGGPSKPFTGAPASDFTGGGMNSGAKGGTVQNMGGMMTEDLPSSSSNKLLKIFIVVFVVIVLVLGGVYGVFILKGKNAAEDSVENEVTADEQATEDLGVNTTTPTTDVATQDETTTEQTSKVRYSEEFLNYLSIDTESESVLTDIQNELDVIRMNLPSQDFSEPITFIITNKQNKPISFSDFAVYADMGMPSDVLLALDDRFEIYAYNDFSTGVRFGFRVDVKNAEILQTALETNATSIPPTSLIFFKNFSINPDLELKFNNGSYNNYAVKYLNLNESETNSIDYIVDGNRWVLGTSQKTLRAIVDKLDKVSDVASTTDETTTTETTASTEGTTEEMNTSESTTGDDSMTTDGTAGDM